MGKQHQMDRDKSHGYSVRTLCGRDMPDSNQYGLESCERCVRVARVRADRTSSKK